MLFLRGHIRRRGATYSIIVDIGSDEDGKRKQKWYSGYKTKKDAEKALNNILVRLENGQFFTTEKMFLHQYLSMWLEDYAQLSLAYKTFTSYKDNIEKYINPHIGNISLQKLKPLHIQSFYKKCLADLSLSGTSTLYLHRILHVALKQAVKWQLLNTNPTDSVEPPKKGKEEMIVLDSSQVKNLLKRLEGTTLYMPVLLAVTTGARRAELCAARWSKIDFESKTLYIDSQLQKNKNNDLELMPTKTKSSKRTIELLSYTIPILKEHLEKQIHNKETLGEDYIDGDFVLCKIDGNPYDPDYITRNFARYMTKLSKELSIPKIRFHDLRHTHATLLLKQGVHIKVVSERLGHASVSITLDTYSHVLPNMQKEAAKKLNDLLDE